VLAEGVGGGLSLPLDAERFLHVVMKLVLDVVQSVGGNVFHVLRERAGLHHRTPLGLAAAHLPPKQGGTLSCRKIGLAELYRDQSAKAIR